MVEKILEYLYDFFVENKKDSKTNDEKINIKNNTEFIMNHITVNAAKNDNSKRLSHVFVGAGIIILASVSW